MSAVSVPPDDRAASSLATRRPSTLSIDVADIGSDWSSSVESVEKTDSTRATSGDNMSISADTPGSKSAFSGSPWSAKSMVESLSSLCSFHTGDSSSLGRQEEPPVSPPKAFFAAHQIYGNLMHRLVERSYEENSISPTTYSKLDFADLCLPVDEEEEDSPTFLDTILDAINESEDSLGWALTCIKLCILEDAFVVPMPDGYTEAQMRRIPEVALKVVRYYCLSLSSDSDDEGGSSSSAVDSDENEVNMIVYWLLRTLQKSWNMRTTYVGPKDYM